MTNKEFIEAMAESWKECYEGAGSLTTDKAVKKLWSEWSRSVKSKRRLARKQKK